MTADRRALLGVDVGSVRVGVALIQGGTDLAVPLETVRQNSDAVHRLATLIVDHEVIRVYVGDPLTLAGDVGPAASAARAFAGRLAKLVPGVDIRLVDERLTTVQSSRQMRAAGRSSRSSRQFLDQAAAVSILQNAVEVERATGRPAGVTVEQDIP